MAVAAEASSEERELSLVGKVELRIGLADGDDKVQSALKTYLAPLLLKLASPHLAVRNKVIAICSHINLRIQPQTIQLPVAQLITQFKANPDSALLRHFDLLYVMQGIRRLSTSDSAALFPLVIRGIAVDCTSASKHAAQLFNIALQLIHCYKIPLRDSPQDLDLRTSLDLSKADAECLASWFAKLILYVPVKLRNNDSSASSHLACPGVTPDEYAFLSLQHKHDTWDPSSPLGLKLSEVKTAAAKLLSSGIFTDHDRFLPALFASADPTSDVCTAGEDMMKRVLPNTNLESQDIIRQLFDYFFGNNDRSRVRAPLRLKIFALLNKSKTSTNFSTDIVKMVDQGISELSSVNGPDAMQIDSTPSMPAREASKLRAALFTYINFVARSASKDTLYAVAPRILEKLKDYIEGQGWPHAGNNEDLAARSLAYEIIGLLAKAGPPDAVIEPNLRIIRWLFMSLANDRSSATIVVSIEEALSSVLSGIARIGPLGDTAQPLEQLLVHQMLESQEAEKASSSDRRSTRHAAVRFANRCLPFDSIQARWVDLLAIASGPHERQDVAEEGRRGMSPYWYRMLNGLSETAEDVAFPAFDAMVDHLFGKSGVAADKSFLTLFPAAFVPALLFCRILLLNEALKRGGSVVKHDSEWARKLDAAVRNDAETRNGAKLHLVAMNAHQQGMLSTLLSTFAGVLSPMQTVGTSNLQDYAEAQSAFIDLCGLCSEPALRNVIPAFKNFGPCISANQIELRTAAAHAFGLLASYTPPEHDDNTPLSAMLDNMLTRVCAWRNAVGAVANQVHGETLALAFYFSRYAVRHGHGQDEDRRRSSYFAALNEQIAQSTDTQMRAGAIRAFGEICSYHVVKASSFGSKDVLLNLVDSIADLAKTGNELAALTLGKVSMILPESGEGNSTDGTDSILKHIEDRLYKLHDIRQAEVHFAVGEAISYLICGWSSKALATALDVEVGPEGSIPVGPEPSAEFVQSVLGKTLRDCSNTKPSLRKASVIWLLCLVQFCGHLPQIQEQLANCQLAFKRGLTDRDDLVQETAARGLGLVYEKGDRKLRDDLVRDLVGSFSDTSKQSGHSQLAGQVGADTQLFEPGALPIGQGESVSTYKDIMNLAAEVGDSSLVYRFMAMASSNAIWSSRAAFGRFGLSNVLSDSSVDGYLAENPKLYPSLYRYRFDSSEAVRRSMNDIWNALVKDTNKTVETHFDAILEDLLGNILGREWRTRQACCAAIADLIQGRPVARYEAYLERIWNSCFKVLDDIKESVRTAAGSLVRVLTRILTRSLESDAGSSSTTSKMLGKVLPFLLSTSGLESGAQEVQAYALKTLLEIIKKSSPATLQPFTPELVERLLGLLSSLEPQAVNYIHLNADKYNLTQQSIDDMRLSSIRSSPLMEACERCLDVMDEDIMALFIPRLQNAIKSAVGLPSKVGSSRLLVSLSTRHNALFRPHADTLLRAIEKAILDRNETVSSSYAASAGYVARGASDKQILALATFARNLYFDSPGDRDQSVPRRALSAAEILSAMSKHATDRFQSLAASLLPFVFVGKHDSSEVVRQIFEETWSNTVGGPRAVALYLREILALVDGHLESAQWAIKHSAARTVAGATVAIAGLVSGSGQGIENSVAETLWPPLERAIGGKTWEGKEVIVEAFVKFVKAAQGYCKAKPEVALAIEKIAIREAKRQNKVYRQSSIPALGEVAAARCKDCDMSDTVYEVVAPILDDILDDKQEEQTDKMDLDATGARRDAAKLDELLARACIDALVNSVKGLHSSDVGLTQIELGRKLRQTLESISRVQSFTKGTSGPAQGTALLNKWLTALEPSLQLFDPSYKSSSAPDADMVRLLLAKLDDTVPR